MDESYNQNEDIIGEEPEYSPKSEFSKARIVYEVVSTCCKSRSKEMRAGYFNTKISKEGMPIKTWIPDAREEFINAVSSLRLLLNPECKRDKEFNESEITLTEQEKKLKEKYSYEHKELVLASKPDGNASRVFKKTGIKFIPEHGASVVIPNKFGMAEHVIGGWDSMINAYVNEKLILYDVKFALLNDLIDRLNYFKQSLSYG